MEIQKANAYWTPNPRFNALSGVFPEDADLQADELAQRTATSGLNALSGLSEINPLYTGAASSSSVPAKTVVASLKTKLNNSYETLAPGIHCINVLTQQFRDPEASTCCIHSFVNALKMLALYTNDLSHTIDFGRDQSIIFYDAIEAQIFKDRGDVTRVDATEHDVRKTWDKIIQGTFIPFFNSTKFQRKSLSIWHSTDDALTTTDAQSLESLANLKDFVNHEGPTVHACMVGGIGHWVTIILEKNECNSIELYGLDSDRVLSESGLFIDLEVDLDILFAVKWILELIKNFDSESQKLYFKSIGSELEGKAETLRKHPITPSEPQLTTSDIDSILLAINFMSRMNWLEQSQSNPTIRHYIETTRFILERYVNSLPDPVPGSFYKALYSATFVGFNPLSPFDFYRAILKLHLPNPEGSQSDLEMLMNIFDRFPKRKESLLRCLNTYTGKEVSKEFEKMVILAKHEYEAVLLHAFEGDENSCKERWERVSELMDLQVYSSHKICVKHYRLANAPHMLFEGSKTNMINCLHDFVSGHEEFRRHLILTLVHELLNNPDFWSMNKLSCLVLQYSKIFSPTGFNVVDTAFVDLLEVAEDTNERSDQDSFRVSTNCYRIHQHLQRVRRTQQPLFRTVVLKDRKVKMFYPPIQANFTKGDLPDGLNREVLDEMFDSIEQRMKLNPAVARAVYAVVSNDYTEGVEVEPTACLEEFRLLKTKFFQDGYIYAITRLPDDENGKVTPGTFYFFSLLEYWRSKSNTPPNDDALSPQEVMLLSNCIQINGCGHGKDEKIFFGFLNLIENKTTKAKVIEVAEPTTLKSNEELKRRNRMLIHLDPIFQITRMENEIIKMFQSETFVKSLLGYSHEVQFEDPIHVTIGAKNNFGRLARLPDALKFDWFMTLPVGSYDESNFITWINSRTGSDSYFSNIQSKIERLQQVLSGELARGRPPVRQPQSSSGGSADDPDDETRHSLYSDLKEIFEKENLRLADYLVMNEEDYSIEGITEEGTIELLKAFGLLQEGVNTLKLDPNKKMEENDVLALIKENPLIMHLDFSDCLWASSWLILECIKNLPGIKSVNLSGCMQLKEGREINLLISKCNEMKIEKLDISRCKITGGLSIVLDSSHALNLIKNDPAEESIMCINQRGVMTIIPLINGIKCDHRSVALRFYETFPVQANDFHTFDRFNFTLREAVDFCIEHQIKTVDLKSYSRDPHYADALRELRSKIEHIKILNTPTYSP